MIGNFKGNQMEAFIGVCFLQDTRFWLAFRETKRKRGHLEGGVCLF